MHIHTLTCNFQKFKCTHVFAYKNIEKGQRYILFNTIDNNAAKMESKVS